MLCISNNKVGVSDTSAFLCFMPQWEKTMASKNMWNPFILLQTRCDTPVAHSSTALKLFILWTIASPWHVCQFRNKFTSSCFKLQRVAYDTACPVSNIALYFQHMLQLVKTVVKRFETEQTATRLAAHDFKYQLSLSAEITLTICSPCCYVGGGLEHAFCLWWF